MTTEQRAGVCFGTKGESRNSASSALVLWSHMPGLCLCCQWCTCLDYDWSPNMGTIIWITIDGQVFFTQELCLSPILKYLYFTVLLFSITLNSHNILKLTSVYRYSNQIIPKPLKMRSHQIKITIKNVTSVKLGCWMKAIHLISSWVGFRIEHQSLRRSQQRFNCGLSEKNDGD